MANTGYKQAVIAYKVDATTGEPLDVDGRRISESGRLQAIKLLVGYLNPDVSRYEVEGFFTAGASEMGEPTRIYDPLNCPSGDIFVTPARTVLAPSAQPYTLVVYSSGPWIVAPNALANLSLYSGPAGYSYIIVTPSANEGQHVFTFTNTQSGRAATHRLILANDTSIWILETGFWNDLGFWQPTGLWNY